MGTQNSLRVLAIAGSLRQASFNKSLLRAAKELAPPNLKIEIFDISAVPLYNGDIEEAGDPDAVTALKTAIKSSHAVLFATPEYNHGVPGVLKNVIDWASRGGSESALAKKPIGILGASPGLTGTARAQSQLRQGLQGTNSYCMPQPEVLVFRAHEKFDGQGNLTDQKTKESLTKYLAAFAAWTEKFFD